VSPRSFECPNCFLELVAGTTQCSRCNIRLSGPEAARLWEVDQQIGVLRKERTDLVKVLLRPAGALTIPAVSTDTPASPDMAPNMAPDMVPDAVPAMAGAHPVHAEQTISDAAADVPLHHHSTPYPTTYLDSGVAPQPKKAMTGQQLLLGLGAILLLSAASFFLLVVWFLVGIVGQAIIMATLTATAVAGSAAATRRGLPAAAETAAVIATGFLLIDLTAAHSLGLAGLDRINLDRYWAGASVLASALLIGFDRLIPRTTRHGDPARRILTYRPAAAFMAAVAPWCFLSISAPDGAALVAALGFAALINALTGFAALQIDAPASTLHSTSTEFGSPGKTGGKVPASAIILFLSAGLGFAAHILSGLALGYDTTTSHADRYTVFLLLMTAPLLGAMLSTSIGTHLGLSDNLRVRLPLWVTLWSLPVLWIVGLTLTYPAWTTLAVIFAALTLTTHLDLIKPNSEVRYAWTKVLSAVAYCAQPAIYTIMLFLYVTDHASVEMVRGWDPLDNGPSLTLVTLTAGVWAVSSLAAVIRKRSAGWVFVAHAAVAATILTSLWGQQMTTWVTAMLAAFAACAALAFASSYKAAQVEPPTCTFWQSLDAAAVIFAGLYASIAVLAGFIESPEWLAAALITVGLLTLAYAAAPDRLPFAYMASLLTSAGAATLMLNESATGSTTYTAPLVGLFLITWVIPSIAAAIHKRSTQWSLVAHVGVAVTLVTTLWESQATYWVAGTLVVFAACTAVAFIYAHKARRTSEHDAAWWRAVEAITVLFGGLYAAVAVFAGLMESPGWLASALISVGVLVLVYAAAPDRLPFAYIGSMSISAGTATLMFEESVTTTEAYTAPLVVLLAAIGFVQWSRDRSLPTTLTMGPALSVALGPSLLAALSTGDTPRLVLVTVAAIAVLAVGLAKRWKAPVTLGALVLLVVAITQGGPLTAYVPGWVTLGAAGAALLAAGVAWEKAILAGKRATVWYSNLT
jgi:hypothetical protein